MLDSETHITNIGFLDLDPDQEAMAIDLAPAYNCRIIGNYHSQEEVITFDQSPEGIEVLAVPAEDQEIAEAIKQDHPGIKIILEVPERDFSPATYNPRLFSGHFDLSDITELFDRVNNPTQVPCMPQWYRERLQDSANGNTISSSTINKVLSTLH